MKPEKQESPASGEASADEQRLPDWSAAAVHVAEIALKGRNRRYFAETLKRNLAAALELPLAAVRLHHERIDLLPPEPCDIHRLLQRSSRVFGVSSVCPELFLPAELPALQHAAIAYYRRYAQPGCTFAVRVKRSFKQYPLTSQELERRIGGAVKSACAAPVDLEQPDLTIRFRLYHDLATLEGPPVPGPGGLPVGTAGRVLVLLSGGIDSPVAAWLVMRRGCRADFLHFHALPDARQLASSKIPRLVQAVTAPQGVRSRLWTAPYLIFQSALLTHTVPQDLELILFRRFMARVAEQLARREGYAAMVTGDNLAQVASQTTENLIAFDQAVDCPVWRPLLTYNKEEIVNLARGIGTFELSIAPYKDCCSIVARHPAVRPALDAVLHAERKLPVEEMVKQALDQLTYQDIGTRPLPSPPQTLLP